MQEAEFGKVEAYVLSRKNKLLCNTTEFGTLRGDSADARDVVCEKVVGAEGTGPGGILGDGGSIRRGGVGGRYGCRSRVSSR